MVLVWPSPGEVVHACPLCCQTWPSCTSLQMQGTQVQSCPDSLSRRQEQHDHHAALALGRSEEGKRTRCHSALCVLRASSAPVTSVQLATPRVSHAPRQPRPRRGSGTQLAPACRPACPGDLSTLGERSLWLQWEPVLLCPLNSDISIFPLSPRPSASSVGSATITLTRCHMASRPTPYRSTTWPTTCECARVDAALPAPSPV